MTGGELVTVPTLGTYPENYSATKLKERANEAEHQK